MQGYKLIYLDENDEQELITITNVTPYYDPDTVIWDERVDKPIPPEVTSNIGGITIERDEVNNIISHAIDFDLKQKQVNDRLARKQAITDAAQKRSDAYNFIKNTDVNAITDLDQLKDLVLKLMEHLNIK